MIGVSRESTEGSCNSCVKRDEPVFEVSIEKGISSTVLFLCRNCLEDLYDEAAEALDK